MKAFQPVGAELACYSKLREQLRGEHPAIDDETLRDTLEGITNLPEMIAEIVRSALIDEAMAAGLKDRIKQMKARFARLEFRAERKRSLATDVLSDADIPKLTEPDFTISLRSSPRSVVVLSETDIPETYWTAQPPKLDRLALLADLKSGHAVPGVTLNNPKPMLTVRTK